MLTRHKRVTGAYCLMLPYDIFMLVVLVGTTLWGLWKGLVWQIASLASIFLSYFVAFQLRDPVSQYIGAKPPWNVFLAMFILYIGTAALVWLVFQFVRAFVDRIRLKDFDHQVGAILGAGKGVLLCVLITLFAVTLMGEPQRQKIIQSRSGYYIAIFLDKSHAILPPEIHDLLHPYLHNLDESLDRVPHDHESKAVQHSDFRQLHWVQIRCCVSRFRGAEISFAVVESRESFEYGTHGLSAC